MLDDFEPSEASGILERLWRSELVQVGGRVLVPVLFFPILLIRDYRAYSSAQPAKGESNNWFLDRFWRPWQVRIYVIVGTLMVIAHIALNTPLLLALFGPLAYHK